MLNDLTNQPRQDGGFLEKIKRAIGGFFSPRQEMISPLPEREESDIRRIFKPKPDQPEVITPEPTPTPTPTPPKIDKKLLNALAMVESSNDPKAVNPESGAQGKFQFMPDTSAYIGEMMGKKFDPFDPIESEEAAKYYLNYLFKRFGSLDLALAAYNAGEGNVEKYGGIPPFGETQEYVKKVLALAGGK